MYTTAVHSRARHAEDWHVLKQQKWKSAQRRRQHYALAVVRWTHKQTHKQTGAITKHCAAFSKSEFASVYKTSSKSDDLRLRQRGKTIFKMAAVLYLEFPKFAVLFMWHVSACDSAFLFQIWCLSDNMELRYSQKPIFNLASVRHIGIVVTSSYCIRELSCSVSNIVLNFQVYWFSTFWYTWTFIFQHFGLKLPILGQILTFWRLIGVKYKSKFIHKRHIISRFCIFWAIVHQNPLKFLISTRFWEKNKYVK